MGQHRPLPRPRVHQHDGAPGGSARHPTRGAEIHPGPPERLQGERAGRIVSDAADEGGPEPQPRTGEHRRGDLAPRAFDQRFQVPLGAGFGEAAQARHEIDGDLAEAHHVVEAALGQRKPRTLARRGHRDASSG